VRRSSLPLAFAVPAFRRSREGGLQLADLPCRLCSGQKLLYPRVHLFTVLLCYDRSGTHTVTVGGSAVPSIALYGRPTQHTCLGHSAAVLPYDCGTQRRRVPPVILRLASWPS